MKRPENAPECIAAQLAEWGEDYFDALGFRVDARAETRVEQGVRLFYAARLDVHTAPSPAGAIGDARNAARGVARHLDETRRGWQGSGIDVWQRTQRGGPRVNRESVAWAVAGTKFEEFVAAAGGAEARPARAALERKAA
jgi:hypothetical protein